MQTTDLKDVWKGLASLIDALPEEEKVQYQNAIRILVHDLRQSVSITHGAETLLRRSIPTTPENLDLLDSIRVANQRVIDMVTDLAKPFDSEIILPIHKLPPDE